MSDVLLAEARALQPETVDLRRRLHRRPELGLHLPETQQAVLETIGDLDVAVETGDETSWVVAARFRPTRSHGAPAG